MDEQPDPTTSARVYAIAAFLARTATPPKNTQCTHDLMWHLSQPKATSFGLRAAAGCGVMIGVLGSLAFCALVFLFGQPPPVAFWMAASVVLPTGAITLWLGSVAEVYRYNHAWVHPDEGIS